MNNVLIFLLLSQVNIGAPDLSRRFEASTPLPSSANYFVHGEIRSGMASAGGLKGPFAAKGNPHGRAEGYGDRRPRLTRVDKPKRPLNATDEQWVKIQETYWRMTGDSALRLQNYDSEIGPIALYGRDLPTDIRSGVGLKTPYGITIEGRAEKGGTGKHNIHSVLCDFAHAALVYQDGYRGNDNGKFVSDPNHGDTVSARLYVGNTPIAVLNKNPQAVGNDHHVVTVGDVRTVFEFHAGVKSVNNYVHVGSPECTVLEIIVTRASHTWSPNARTFQITVDRDQFPDSVAQSFKLLKLTPGADLGSDDLDFSKFVIDIDFIGTLPPGATWDSLVELNGFNDEFININVPGLEPRQSTVVQARQVQQQEEEADTDLIWTVLMVSGSATVFAMALAIAALARINKRT